MFIQHIFLFIIKGATSKDRIVSSHSPLSMFLVVGVGSRNCFVLILWFMFVRAGISHSLAITTCFCAGSITQKQSYMQQVYRPTHCSERIEIRKYWPGFT